MNRSNLFALADKYRKDGKADKAKLRAELIEYFKSEQGQAVLNNAPKVTIDYGGNIFDSTYPLQEQPLERIVDLILQEVV